MAGIFFKFQDIEIFADGDQKIKFIASNIICLVCTSIKMVGRDPSPALESTGDDSGSNANAFSMSSFQSTPASASFFAEGSPMRSPIQQPNKSCSVEDKN